MVIRILFILIFTSGSLLAQKYDNIHFSYLNAETGLGSDMCNFVYKDKDEFIWIGTNEGLFRYDGYELININVITDGKVPKAEYIKAKEDAKGTLWFASTNGLIFYDKEKNDINIIKPSEQILDSDVNDRINAIEFDSSGRIWFGGHSGLFIYDLESKKLKYFRSIGDKVSRTGIRDILRDSNGDIWISSWGSGLGKYQPQTESFTNFNLEFSKGSKTHNTAVALLEDKNGILWVGTWESGLIALDIKDSENPKILKTYRRSETSRNTILGNIIFDLEEDAYGNIWIATPYGLSILSNSLRDDYKFDNYVYHKEKKHLSNNAVRSIFRDNTGLMWLATSGGGVNKVDLEKKKFSPYLITDVDSMIKSQSVQAFTYDHKGRLLVGVYSLGFGVYDLENRKFVHYSEVDDYKPLAALNINTVKNFTWDETGNLWLGTRYNGVIKYDPDSKKYVTINKGYFHKEVYKVHMGTGNNLIVLTNAGLHHIFQASRANVDNYKVHQLKIVSDGRITEPRIVDFFVDETGLIYIATETGKVFRSTQNINDFIFEQIYEAEKKVVVNSIYKDHKERLWIGTSNGFRIIDPDKPKAKPFMSEFHDLNIFSMKEGRRGDMVVLSNKGLIYIKCSDENLQPVIYNEQNGLQGNVFIKGALYSNEKDDIFFIGGHSGFNMIDESKLAIDSFFNKVVLTNLKTSDKEYYSSAIFNSANPFIVNYNDNIISLTFASLDQRSPSKIQYSYMLEGLDKDWIYVPASKRSATYINLKPGNYRFKVKSTNSSGNWSDEITELPIYVTTAPYLTWWAKTLYVCAVVMILTLIFMLYRRQSRARQALKLEHVDRSKSEKLHQFKLQFFTNLSHELLTPLSILMVLSDKLNFQDNPDSNIFKRNIRKLHEQIKQMLIFRKAETGNMELQAESICLDNKLKEILENYKVLAKEKEITFKTLIEDDLQGYIDLEKVEICLNNLLSNAFKYTPKDGLVYLEIKTIDFDSKEHLQIVVKDSGKGISNEYRDKIFNRFYRLGGFTKHEEGLGIGLALTKNLVEIQKGNITVESELQKGSIFTIVIPMFATDDQGLYNGGQSLINNELIEEEKRWIPSNNVKGEFTTSGKTVLLVEDNKDFLTLMEQHLKEHYKVLVVQDGNDALEIANSNEVDIIVSDLLIPGMNGFEFCKEIKSNVNTSHIPFIIVTARTEDHERLVGYDAGADSYLTKPLNLDVLSHRIESLLKGREKIHTEFNSGAYLEPNKIVTTTIDEEFLIKAKDVVEKSIADPEFSVKDLCEELAMSNSMFYRKLKGILNLTPNEYIKNIRLRRAAQLLEDKDIHISDVAFSTGFNDLSYFGVCFKKQYGVTPSVYQKEKSENGTGLKETG